MTYFATAPFQPDPVCAGVSLREGQQRLSGMNILPAERVILWRRQGGRCFYCDTPMVGSGARIGLALHPRAMTIDHILTRLDGGRNGPKVGACITCNASRATMPAHEFVLLIAQRQGFLPKSGQWMKLGDRTE